MSQAKVAFAEGTIRSLKKILYRYMEDNEYKYIHILKQFVTTVKSSRNWSIDMIPLNEKNSDFFVHSVQQTTTRIYITQV